MVRLDKVKNSWDLKGMPNTSNRMVVVQPWYKCQYGKDFKTCPKKKKGKLTGHT